jgi:hypothetical protein
MDGLHDFGDSLWYSFNRFISFLPTLLGAILVLIIGWFLSGAIATLIEKGLRAVGLETAMQKSGLNEFVQKSGSKWTASRVIAEMVKWFIRLIFIQAAANLLGMPQLTDIINSILLFIPQVIVAIAIIVIGTLVAKFLAQAVRASLGTMGSTNPEFFAKLVQYAVVGFAVIAAISQLGIAPTIVNTLFMGLIGAISLAIGLAFGLGGKDTAAKITERWYQNASQMADRARAQSPSTGSMPPPPIPPAGGPATQTPPGSPIV